VNWQPIPDNKYALRSDCGRYSVCKIGSESGRFTYSAWLTPTHPCGRFQLSTNLPDANTAKLVCDDYESRL
jgi:hypothetical protein